PGVLARATRCDRGPVAVRTSHRQLTGDGRLMERALFRIFRMDWNHEPDNAVGARLCEPQRVATTPSSAGHRPALRDARFMESPLSLRACIGTRNRSGSDRGRSSPAAAAPLHDALPISRGAGAGHTLRPGTGRGPHFAPATH